MVCNNICYVHNTGTNEGRKCFIKRHTQHILFTVIWRQTILIVRKKTSCRHIGYSFRLTARVLLYAPSHRQDSTYHSLCYTSRGALAGTRNSSMRPPHEGSIRRPIAPWANSYHGYTVSEGNVRVTRVSADTVVYVAVRKFAFPDNKLFRINMLQFIA